VLFLGKGQEENKKKNQKMKQLEKVKYEIAQEMGLQLDKDKEE